MSARLPFPLIWLYPELPRFGARQAQWEALMRANRSVSYVFAAILLVAPLFLADWIEARLKEWLGLRGAASDLAAASVFGLVMLIVLVAIVYVTTRATRRRLRAELAAGGHTICVPCGYDLRGQTTPRCPECGAAAAGEADAE